MIARLLAFAVAAAAPVGAGPAVSAPGGGAALGPSVITVARADGEMVVPVRIDEAGVPRLPAPTLAAALHGSVTVADGWAELVVAQQTFRFLVGAPLYVFSDRLRPLAAPSVMVGDTLFLPFQFVAEVVPYFLGERFTYDETAARLVDRGAAPVKPALAFSVKRLPNGLRQGHVVAVDAGHGGVDPGNPGMYFPSGIREKDVTLQVAVLLREELQRRGVGIRMTRTSDTLIALGDRSAYCTNDCDLFVSLHVNSLPRRPGFTNVSGFETYFLAEAKTEDAARVARMENDAVRFEPAGGAGGATGGLDFILKDLQLNEHLRESARLAQLVQDQLGPVHTGGDRGVKQAGFMVLTTARRPAILVEMGYSTNPDDGRLLTRHSSQRALAAAIADAVVKYLLEYERKTDP